MKKTLWMLGVAVAAFTSCTQNEVLEVPESRIINFDAFVGKSTRAAIPINQAQDNSEYDGVTPPKSNLHQFWVFGTESGVVKFDGTDEKAKVYFKKVYNTFSYDNHLTWVFGKTYNFAAYSNGNYPLVGGADLDAVVSSTPDAVKFSDLSDGNGTIYGSKLFFDNYTVDDLDLLAAITQTQELPTTVSSVTPVPLTFQHMLSLINIRLENNTEDLHMQINNITFTAIKTDDCTYVINRQNTDATKSTREVFWENMNSTIYNDDEDNDRITGEYTFKGTAKGIQDANSLSDDPADYLAPGQAIELTYFVIPQNNQNIKDIVLQTQSYHRTSTTNENVTTYSYTLANNNGSVKEHKISLAVSTAGHTSWQPGYRYNYVGSLSGNAHFIHFNVEGVNAWSDSNENVDGSPITE